MDFPGKVAIVTGGAQGIGRAYCRALLNVGMKITKGCKVCTDRLKVLAESGHLLGGLLLVCICDINEDVAKEFIGSFPEGNKYIIFQKCDVTVFEEFKGVFDKVILIFGRIDLVVNNAGILNEYDWRRMIDIDFIGVIHGIKLGFEYMDINKGGHGGYIVNTASSAGFVDGGGVAPVYVGCKHGVVGLTKSYGTDMHFKKTGIKVGAVCPTLVETPLFYKIPETILSEESGKEMLQKQPLKPEDVAKALIRILTDGKNGALLKLNTTDVTYVQ